MTWHCQTCTYRNLNDGSARCHACGTVRAAEGESSSSRRAIVDLTGCSPKPTDGGNMESNRSRRRRKQEQMARGGEAAASTSQKTSSSNAAAKGKANGIASGTSRKNEATPGKKCVIDVDVGVGDNNNNDWVRSRGKVAARHAREGGDDDDMIVDPPPRGKVPLNTNDVEKREKKAHSQPELRKESKLKTKKRKMEQEKRSQEDKSLASFGNPDQRQLSRKENNGNGHKEQSTSNAETKARHGDGSKKRKLEQGKMSQDYVGKGRTIPSHANSEHWRRSSKESESAQGDHSSMAGKSDDQQKTGGRLTDFYNKQTRPQASVEQLMGRANSILRQTFKHQSLRPLQEAAVKGALQRSSQLVIMATGGGKSLTYQLPALAGGNNINANVRAENSSVTIVVCPLIALMIDQVNNLCRKGVRTAACLSSSLSQKAKQEIYNRLQTDKSEAKGKITSHTAKVTPIQILYCTPELIETDKFRVVLKKLYNANRLYMFAIDEAHCLSTWGHDFRPAYRKLTWVRETFPDVPVAACTGTATKKVIQDVRDVLNLDQSVPCLMGTFNRPNLTYQVRFKDSLNATSQGGALADLVSVVKNQHDMANKENRPCNGIVYCHKKDDCQTLAAQISKATGLVCLAYHGGLKDSQREETQRKWTEGTCQIAVATIAFGMGIDLPHVRYVIHWNLAKTLEGFYQESGRGGRDGKPSLSVLYYSKDDASRFEYLLRMNAESQAKKKGNASQMADHSLVELEQMVNYCTTPTCRRVFVLKHFGEVTGSLCNKTCDFCIDPKRVERDTRASECMSSVLNSHRMMMHAGRKHLDEEQKFHHNPLEDEDSLEDGSDDFFGPDDGLGITGYAGEDEKPLAMPSKNGFVKASSVLSKYETMECQGQKKATRSGSGFVNFKTRTFAEEDEANAKKHRAVNIPEHLRKGLPDPLAAHNKPKPAAKSSKAYASESERLKAELAELEKQKAEALAKMNLSSRSTSKMLPPPPPPLSFKR